MFINSKKKFIIYKRDGGQFVIEKDFIGNIPDQVGAHWLIQAAIADGSIATPDNTSLTSLENADTVADEKAEAADIRSDDGVQEKEETAKEKRSGK